MYSNQFKKIVEELSGTDHNDLLRIAAAGGWRKRFLDKGRAKPSSMFDLLTFATCAVAGVISLLPPFGNAFRRSLVAQDILDRKGMAW